MCGVISLVMICSFSGSAQTSTDQETLQQVTALRDNFVAKIKTAGLSPSLPPPVILFDNPQTMGNYDDTTNSLHTTGAWTSASNAMKTFFERAASHLDSTITGRTFYERATHQWIFIHEMGHWWRACEHQKTTPYLEELGANRIAIAYWRDTDPDFMKWQEKMFESYVQHSTSPVPANVSKEKYFNDNYESLAADSRFYTWYQAQMIIQAYHEQPVSGFVATIRASGN